MKNEWKVFEDWGCHAGPVNSTIEAFDKGVWKTITKSQGFEIDKNCPSTHPGRPFASISLENGQLFRWRIESGWIAYSPIRAYFSDEKVSSAIPLNVTEPDFKLISSNNTNSSSKPSTPTFSGINFSGNKVNISVNLGNNNANKPDKVYLVAPKLGFTSSNPNIGKIIGNTGTWSIDVNQILPGTTIPLEVVSERSGTKSDSLYGAYRIPETQKITAVPEAPKKYSQRVVGTSMLIRVEVSQQNGAKAENVFLYSPTLNISKTKPLKGDIFGTEAIFEIPIKPSMVGKKYGIVIFLENSKGRSKPLNATLSIPGNPKLPSTPQLVPVPQQPKTVICLRTNQTRAFEGTSCPPGWSKK